MQELGIPFICWSTSEPVPAYRDFQLANHPHVLVHQHLELKEQLSGKPCARHSTADACKVEENPDLLVIGAPCNPFSCQRQDRFSGGSVEQHKLFQLSFQGVADVLRSFSPDRAVMETTDGFLKPLQKGGEETPLLMLLGRAMICAAASVGCCQRVSASVHVLNAFGPESFTS